MRTPSLADGLVDPPATKRVHRGPEHTHDVIVVGGGTGGYSTALRAAQLGLGVALIERDRVGGTCLHRGCIPTKAILQSAEAAEWTRQAEQYGIRATFDGVEMAAVGAHRDAVVQRMHAGLEGALRKRGVETVVGHGRLAAADTVEVVAEDGTRTLKAPAIVIATGSRPRALPGVPFDGDRVLSSDHALELDRVPDTAVILGSGAVGMEFATAWHAFGVDVTLIELEDRLLPLEDSSTSREVDRAFRKRGVDVRTSTELTAAKVHDGHVSCGLRSQDGEASLDADVLLVAIGREPVTNGLDLAEVGVAMDRDFVGVDPWCRTSVPGIYAVGDVIPTLSLAHASFAEGVLVADQLGGEAATPIDHLGVPRVTYSHPEVASVGYTEVQAQDAGFDVVTETYSFQGLARAAMAHASGAVKVVAERQGDAPGGAGRVLGIHVVGPRATDLIAEAQLIYNWDALPIDVAQLIHPHPSFSEALGEAHLALAGRALHG